MTVLTPGLFNQELAYRRRSGVSRTGDFSFDAAVNFMGRVEAREELRRTFDGEEVISSHIIYTTTPIFQHDIIYLSRSDSSQVSKGIEPMSIWSTPSMNNSERLYKIWMNFFA